jgi:hypothetical protein
MSRKARRRAGPPALELIETAVQLLRTAPAGVLLAYYAGSIPCVLGVLYFWADMSRGAFARDHLIEASLSTALLYVWMKCWQTVFASKLHAHLISEPEAPWTLGRVTRMVLTQATVQPTGLFVRQLAGLVLIPYVWTYAFYQNVGILGDGTRASVGEVMREASHQAGLWTRQAHSVLTCLFGFALFVWLNVLIAFRMAPALLKTFFGIETMLSRDPALLWNTTTLVATLGVTYLCVDPIRKAVFVLRCFYGASLQSGEDLHMELKSWHKPLRAAVAVLILAVTFLSGAAAARATEPPPPPAKIESGELSKSVERVLQRREYAWRLPRAETAADEENKGWLTTFIEQLWNRLVRLTHQVMHWWDKVWDWFRRMFDREPAEHASSSGTALNWAGMARGTLYVLVAILVVVLAVLLWRWHKGRRVRDPAGGARSQRRECHRRPIARGRLVAAGPRTHGQRRTAARPPGLLSRDPRPSRPSRTHSSRPP